MLGSSDFGAQAAGLWGLPYAFAHHFSPHNTMAAVRIYRDSFKPSAVLEHPYLMIAVSVLCADSDEDADYLAGSGRLSFLRLRTGRPGRVPSPAEAAAYPFTPGELARDSGMDRRRTSSAGPTPSRQGCASCSPAPAPTS